MIPSSQLLVNNDGSIYHLSLRPEQVAERIVLVGDPGRVSTLSSYFDKIDHKIANREFLTHTGWYKGKRLSIIATGIGTDNIDIVLNELDALFNIDLQKRVIKDVKTSLRIIRLGTTGSIQASIPAGNFVVSSHGLGLDGVIHFYGGSEASQDMDLQRSFMEFMDWPVNLSHPYFVSCSEEMMKMFPDFEHRGIAATAPGFYAPQGRVLRLPLAYPEMNEKMAAFDYNGIRVTNYEMETSSLYGLGKMLGHRTITVCAVIANRATEDYINDYKPIIDALSREVLDRLTSE